ncbi:MAG: hypothetical protein AAGL98_00300 [Planctomycetota bacterium]
MMPENWTGPLPEGWSGGEAVTKFWHGSFVHLYRVTRPCVTCGTEISLDVSKRALDGEAKNSGLLLRNCPTCRAARKNGAPGSRGGKSRPQAPASEHAPAPAATPAAGPYAEVVRERDEYAETIMELTSRNRALFEELQQCKARLATYELQGAMANLQRQDGPSPHAAGGNLTFPWQ